VFAEKTFSLLTPNYLIPGTYLSLTRHLSVPYPAHNFHLGAA